MVKYSRKNNFSLIEVLVALTIIAVCFNVYMQALTLNIKNTGVSKSYITANLLAKKKLVQLAANDKIKIGKKNGAFGDNYLGFEWETNVKEQSKYLYLIKLSISFIRDGNKRKLVFNTLSINKAAFKDKDKDKDKDSASEKDSKNNTESNS